MSGPKCKRQIEDVRDGGAGGDKYCRELLAATNTARVMTLLALLLTVVGARGLCRYRRSPNEATRVKSFERCCGLLAIGGLIGLISAATYTSMMEKAAKDLDAEKNFFTDTRAAGCALSLAASIISMVAGAAAVVLQRKWPGASDPTTKASKPTTGKKSGGCCAGDPKNHGCWAVPDGSNEGRAAQFTSSLGLILAVICLIVNFVFYTWAWASVLIDYLDVPGAGIGIYIQLLSLFLSIIAYSRGLYCVTGERGWNCTAGFLRVLSVLYLVAFVCINATHGDIDKAIDKECDDDDWGNCRWVSASLDRVFSFVYACVVLNLIFSLISAYYLKRAAPDWVDRDASPVDRDAGEASSGGLRVKIKENFGTQSNQYCTVATLEVPAGHKARGARVTGKWRDQGWGNRKGKVRLVLLHRDKEVAASSTDSCAPHSWAKLSLALDGFSAAAGDVLAVQVRVGGGGGHELKLNATAILDTALHFAGSIVAKRNNEVARTETFKNYELSFKMKLAREWRPGGGWKSIIHIGDTNGHRLPGIWFHESSNALHVMHSMAGRLAYDAQWGVWATTGPEFTAGETYDIRVVVKSNQMTVYVDGVSAGTASGSMTYVAKNAAVYVGDPWHDAAKVTLSDVRLKDTEKAPLDKTDEAPAAPLAEEEA